MSSFLFLERQGCKGKAKGQGLKGFPPFEVDMKQAINNDYC